jgi:hypothetical protein
VSPAFSPMAQIALPMRPAFRRGPLPRHLPDGSQQPVEFFPGDRASLHRSHFAGFLGTLRHPNLFRAGFVLRSTPSRTNLVSPRSGMSVRSDWNGCPVGPRELSGRMDRPTAGSRRSREAPRRPPIARTFSTMPFSMRIVSTRFRRLPLNPRTSRSVRSGNRVCGRLLVGSEQCGSEECGSDRCGSTVRQPTSPCSVLRSEAMNPDTSTLKSISSVYYKLF